MRLETKVNILRVMVILSLIAFWAGLIWLGLYLSARFIY